MSREILFRAYNKETDEMYNVDSLTPHYIFAENILDGIGSHGVPDNRECVELMQYTGLKDRNGTKIFEGDILRFPAKNEWQHSNYACFEVFFHDGDANIDYNIGYSMNRIHFIGSMSGTTVPSFKPKTVSEMEVIGNIHENPELLKK